jgi:ubiquinol-cytochrome c reductase iron-sulfur subunit
MVEQTAGAHEETRRDFLYVATATVAAVGAACAIWPLIDQMNPSQDVLALSSIEVDLTGVEVGQQLTVSWRGKPLFIRHRTDQDIADAEAVNLDDLKDPQPDSARVIKPEWLIMIGVCTHLGCIPLANAGDFHDGWFCPCHGSQYDSSGRIRSGPAPLNLAVPGYEFLDDTTVRVG